MINQIVYYDRKIVWVTLGNRGVMNMNVGWGDADFIIYKGATAILEFVVRDIDRKPVNLTGKKVSATLIYDKTQEMLLEKDLVEYNVYDRGRVKLTLQPSDFMNWPTGIIRYSLTLTDIDAHETVYLYNDFAQGAIGYIELRDTAMPKPPQPQQSVGFTPSNPDRTEPTKWCSGVFKGPAQLGSIGSMSTVAIYLDNFSGTITAEASLDPVPLQSVNNWFTIQLVPGMDELEIENCSRVQAFNIFGDFHWLRFCYSQDSGQEGSITKILLN